MAGSEYWYACGCAAENWPSVETASDYSWYEAADGSATGCVAVWCADDGYAVCVAGG